QQKARWFCEAVLEPLEPVVEARGHLPITRRAHVRQAVMDWGFAGINHARRWRLWLQHARANARQRAIWTGDLRTLGRRLATAHSIKVRNRRAEAVLSHTQLSG